jgi:phenylacetic acid degradation operon negative regulatory protein
MTTNATLTGPAASRRRELGEASARSLLMTVLGEFVLQPDTAIWTSALVRVLAMLGVEEKSARQALSRTAAEGLLASLRHGRRVRWSLTGPGRRLLSDGADRIYSFGRQQQHWDHRWLVLIVTVPETKRELRHRLRTRLSWAGFGAPSPGVWVTPDTGHEAEARRILDELGLARGALSFTASHASIGTEETVLARAWDLHAVAARYDAFIEDFAELQPVSGDEIMIAQIRLVHEWRRFPFLDPQLPAELLPDPWSGTAAAQLFHSRHAEWERRARQRWRALAAEPWRRQSGSAR